MTVSIFSCFCRIIIIDAYLQKFQDTEEFYTGPSAFDEVQSYRRDKGAKERKFKAFVLSDFHDKLLLSKNASVLYRVSQLQLLYMYL